MPVWALITIGVGALLAVIAGVVLVVVAWRSYERRALLRLLVRAEAVDALESGLVESFNRLVASSDEELEVFAEEPESPERHVLAEIRMRANMLADELDRMALPKRVIPAAEALADAAYTICEQAGSVRDTDTGEVALDHLADIDLALIHGYVRKARHLVTGTCDVCGLDDASVYGGGLYL